MVSTLVTRQQSGLRKPRWGPSHSNGSKGVVIHYVGGGRYGDRDPHQLVRDIQQWHFDRGWRDIAYNLLAAPGLIFEGRSTSADPYVRSAATGHMNDRTFAVCALVGDDDDIGDELLHTLGDAVRWLRREADAARRVSGHRDFMATVCPGDYLYRSLSIISRLADNDQPDPQPEPKPEPRMPRPMPFTWRHVQDTLGKDALFAYPCTFGPNCWNGTTSGGQAARPIIREIQTSMNSRGYTLQVDGRYGPHTDKMVNHFQANVWGVKPGPFGPRTWQKIHELPIKP